VAIVLAIMGFGIASFAWAALVRGASGTLLIYYLAPWSVSISFSKKSAKRLLSFGVPFQLNSFLALIKDDFMTIFLGKILPFAEIGYIGWAKKWAEIPLRLVMDNVIKVTFPAYSRLQGNAVYLGKAVEKSLFFIAILFFPIVTGLVIFIKPLVFLLPRYQKWEPALILFYLFSLSAIVSSFSGPLTNALSAIGKIRITLCLMVMWTVLTWLLVPFLVFKFGYNGVGYGAALLSLTIFVVLAVVKKYINYSLFPKLIKPSLATLGMILTVVVFLNLFGSSWLGLVISGVGGLLVYGTLILFLARGEILPEIKDLLMRKSF
jgi:O-antigen/teichoic acid export membrane protein